MLGKKQYTFERESDDGSGLVLEKVDEERWGWGVIYDDDTELHQFGNDGKFHQFREIDRERVKLFAMYKVRDMSKRYDIPVEKDMQIFHFYRNVKPHYRNDFVKVYVFGYKRNGEVVHHFILPDDRMVISPKDSVDLNKFNV